MFENFWIRWFGGEMPYCLSVGASLPVVHWEGLSSWEVMLEWRRVI
jgi:hypothetical protein